MQFPHPRIALTTLAAALLFCLLAGCAKTPEDHARIAKTHRDSEKRNAAVQALDSQTLLADVASNADDRNTRLAAVAKITDEQLLAQIARKITIDTEMISRVMAKIRTPALLSDLAKNATSPDVRIAAAGPDDQPALVEIVKKKSLGKTIRQRALAKLTDQTLLAELSRPSADIDTRKAAISRLTDQQTLLDLIKNDPDIKIREHAVKHLTDQKTLLEIALANPIEEDGHSINGMAAAAMETITDQTMLVEIAEKVPFPPVAWDAIRRVTDEQLLISLAKDKNRDYDIRRIATEKLTNQKILSDLAQNDTNSDIRAAATANLDDPKLLASIAKNDRDDNVRKNAVEKLTDQELLADIAINDKEEHITWSAFEKLKDQRLMADIATHAASALMREAAIEKITDQHVLAGLAQNGANAGIRLWALWGLKDAATLDAISKNDPDELVRKAAGHKKSPPLPIHDNTRARTTGNLAALLNDGKIIAQIKGDGISNVNVNIKKMVPYPLEVLIPAGSYFLSDDDTVQNMVSTSDTRVTLTGDSRATSVPVACAQKPKDIPDSHNRFTLAVDSESGAELQKLMAVINKQDVSFATRQASVWIVTDDPGYDGLGTLRESFYGMPGARTINEPEAARAMQLCAEAGIDIKMKRIWRDKTVILAGLTDETVKTWLETF